MITVKFFKRIGKKIISLAVTCSMLASGLSLGFISKESLEVKAAQQEQMKMPIVVLDHLNDNLLFEYLNVDKIFGLSMFKDNPGDPDSDEFGKGLVENELGPNGTPVYKQEVVERIAGIVQYTLEYIRSENGYDTRTDITELYRKISAQILSIEPEQTTVEENSANDVTKSLEEMGWSFAKADSSKTESPDQGQDTYYDVDGNKLWWRYGDQLFTDDFSAENTASFDFGQLDAGTYRVYAVWANNVDAKLTTPDGEETVNFVAENDESQTGTGRGGVIYDFTTTQLGDVKITFSANGNGQANIADFRLVEIKEGEKTQILGNQIARTGNVGADKLGWTIEEGSTWTAFSGGGITCEQGEATKAYKEVAVTAGEKYKFRAEMNDNNLCKIWLEDESGNVLIDKIPINDSEEGLVEIPENVEKVRIYVENIDTTAAGTRRVGQIFMTSQAKARLGDYNQSKTKYDNGAKLNDIETCMDYAYYMLNNFWTDTNGDITQKTDLYKTLTLNLGENSDKYQFSTSNKIYYDIENKTIWQDATGDNTGMFPLDSSALGEANDLTAPFGVADGEINNHNYHYGLKAHCQFLYDSSKDLEFLFNGDDDVYLFIDGKLAMDIGGAHGPKDGSVVLSYHAADPNAADQVAKEQLAQETAAKLGLVDGEVYDFDFFYLERHTSLSTMLIETNMPLLQAGVTPKVTYKVDGQEIADGSKIETGKKVDVEYNITSNTKIANNAPNKLTGLEVSDNALGVFIGKDDNNQLKIELGDAQVDDAITVTVKDADGNVTKTITISKDELANQTKVEEFVSALSGINLDNKESVTISGISIPMPSNKKLESELDITAVSPEAYFGDGGTIQYKNSEVSTVPVTVAAIPVNEPEIAVEGRLVDDSGNAYSNNQNLAEGTSVNVEFTVTSKAADMTSIGIDDAFGSGFVMNKVGINIPDGFDINNGLVVTYTKTNGTTEKVTLSKADIENKTDAYNNLLNKLGNNVLDAWKLGPNETITVTGLHKNMEDAEIQINPMGIATGPVPTYNEETDEVTVVDKNVDAMDAVKKVIPLGKINVTFDPTEKGSVTEGNASQTIQIGYGVVTPTISEQAGYEFKGWKIDGDNTDTLYQAEDIDKMIFDEDTTFVAQYDTIKVNVNFEKGDNGTLSGETNQEVDYNTGVESVPNATPDLGYGFIGWKKQGDVTDKIYSNNEIIGFTFTEDTTFVAQYELGKVTVTFDAKENGNITEGDVSQTINSGEGVTTPTISVNNGYTFKGWTIEGDNTGKLYQAEDIDEMTFTENTTFTAQYDAITYTYTVKYVDEDGKAVADAKLVENIVAGTEVEEFPASVDGYEAEKDSITETIDSDGKEIVFIYAKKKLNVTYEAGSHGKLEGIDSETVEYGDKPTNVPTPTADEDYKFVGWTMTVTAGNSSVDDPAGETITEDVVFTAVFEPINTNYIVKYVDESGKEIFKTKAGYTPVGEKVTETAENIPGYKLVGDETVTITILDNAEENVIVFKYTKSEEPTTEEPTTTAPSVEEPTTTSPVVEEPTTKKKVEPTTKKKVEPTTKKKVKPTTEEEETTEESTSNSGSGNTNTSTVSPKTGGIDYMLAVLFGILFAGLGLLYYSYFSAVRSCKKRS